MLDRTVSRYLEECGSACPRCRGSRIIRYPARAEAATIPAEGEQRTVRLDCFCGGCDRDWVEVYRLVGIEEPAFRAPSEGGEGVEGG